MSDQFIFVHPNNRLTRLNNFSIPNLESYSISLQAQIDELDNPLSSAESKALAHVDKGRLQRLKDFKASELKYIQSYLKILKNLDSVCKTCQIGECYDYEREDEILNKIENEMKVFRSIELELARNKQLYETDGKVNSKELVDISSDRRDSILQLERDISAL